MPGVDLRGVAISREERRTLAGALAWERGISLESAQRQIRRYLSEASKETRRASPPSVGVLTSDEVADAIPDAVRKIREAAEAQKDEDKRGPKAPFEYRYPGFDGTIDDCTLHGREQVATKADARALAKRAVRPDDTEPDGEPLDPNDLVNRAVGPSFVLVATGTWLAAGETYERYSRTERRMVEEAVPGKGLWEVRFYVRYLPS